MTTVWAPRALAEVDAQATTWINRRIDGTLSRDEYLRGLQSLNREAQRLRDGGMPMRGRRRMPSLRQIAEHHKLGDEPSCVRCLWTPPVDAWRNASGWLERAHIIDRGPGGLDGPQNLLPLCGGCHRQQPMFEPGQEREALAWFWGGAA